VPDHPSGGHGASSEAKGALIAAATVALVSATVLLTDAVLPGSLTAAPGTRCRAHSPGGSDLPRWAGKRRATVLVDSVLLGGLPALRAKRPCWRIASFGRPALMVRIAEQELRRQGRPVAPRVIVGLG
jgi:hypothetical protein